MTHTLKTDSDVFQSVFYGLKTYELRKADRSFAVGDCLDLRETKWTGAEMAQGAPLEYTGRAKSVVVSHVLRGPIYGLAEGWVLLSFQPDEIDRLRAEVARLQQWQPIETAPRDGREVILAVAMRAGIPHGVLVGHYMPGGHCIEDHPAIGAGWYFWNGCMFDEAANPTHWMAMPCHPNAADWQREKQHRGDAATCPHRRGAPTDARCACWLGQPGATFGSSEAREACAVHGIKAEAAQAALPDGWEERVWPDQSTVVFSRRGLTVCADRVGVYVADNDEEAQSAPDLIRILTLAHAEHVRLHGAEKSRA